VASGTPGMDFDVLAHPRTVHRKDKAASPMASQRGRGRDDGGGTTWTEGSTTIDVLHREERVSGWLENGRGGTPSVRQ
jgi:hypothetical protein